MSITSRINEMSTHIEQAYDELQGLGADLTNVNKNIENISMVLDDIYDSMPQVSGEGTSLTLDDTRVGKIKSTLKGNTSQDGTPTPTTPIPVNVVSGDNEINVVGKNLLNYVDNLQTPYRGLTSTINNDGGITTTGIPQYDYTSIIMYNISSSLENGATYTLSQRTLQASKLYLQLNIVDLNGGATQYASLYNTTSVSFTADTTNKKYIINLQTGTVSNWGSSSLTITNYYQLEKGSSATSYEPYQGNTYNIDLPVENVLANPSDNGSATGVGNMTLTWNTSNDFHLSGSATSTGNVWGGTVASDYTIKEGDYLHLCNDSVPSGIIQFVGLTPQLAQAFVATINSKNKVLDLTSYVGKTIHSVFFYCVSGASADMTMTPMIVNGMSKVLSFTPYGTTPIELCKIGNYQDYFYKDSGKWYLHKEIGKVVLNGSEDIVREQIANNHYKFYIQNISNIDYGDVNYIPKILCNKLIAVGRTPMYVNTQGITSGNGSLQIYTDDTKDMTSSEFRTWLGSNNIIAYYGLITPTTTEITYEPLIEQLNALELAQSKENQTNISQINNDLPFIISASALKEWQESASLNSTLSMVNPLSLGNTLNTQEIENNIQPIEVDNIEPLEEEENEES